MKLSVLSELSETQCDNIVAASDLYNALKKLYTEEEVALARFIYALEKLGHRRYGCRAIRDLEDHYHPPPFDFANLDAKVDRKDFILHQRLAVLCCMLPEDNYKDFITYFAKKESANPKLFHTPCQILKKVLQSGSIPPHDLINEIEEMLIKTKVSEAAIRELFDNYQRIGKSQMNR